MIWVCIISAIISVVVTMGATVVLAIICHDSGQELSEWCDEYLSKLSDGDRAAVSAAIRQLIYLGLLELPRAYQLPDPLVSRDADHVSDK